MLTSLFVFSILVHLCLGGDAHHLCRSLLDAADDTSMIRILLRDFFAGYQKKMYIAGWMSCGRRSEFELLILDEARPTFPWQLWSAFLLVMN